LRPSDPQVLELQSWIQRRLGDFEGKIESVRLARTLDPRNPYWTTSLVSSLMMDHRYDEASKEIESAPIEDFELSVLHSMLQLRDHRDPRRRLADLAALQSEYGMAAVPFELWEAHIAARDFEGAVELLDSIEAADPPADDWTVFSVPDTDVARIITYGFLDARHRLGSLLEQARVKRDAARVPDASRFVPNRHLELAFITAVEGNAEEAERLIRTWMREAAGDLAELTNQRHYACRALGMAAASSAAVECIRSALAEPSFVMPFIEPLMPYYDTIRTQPGFVELVAEIQAR